MQIAESDLKPVLEGHAGNRMLDNALRGVESGHGMIRLIGQYTLFNSVFGGGVANLAGEIAERQDMFGDNAEEISSLSDRSAFVAARIFAASVPEFGGENCGYTHRSLAQATLKGLAQFFELSPGIVNDALVVTPALTDAIAGVQYGYGSNRELDEIDLFRGIGFHMGSECLADDEFNIIDQVLGEKWAKLVSFLESTNVSVGGEIPHPAYEWVKIHTTVEADHFRFALEGVNLALQYYRGQHSQEEVTAAIIDGFVEFARVQLRFMEFLAGR